MWRLLLLIGGCLGFGAPDLRAAGFPVSDLCAIGMSAEEALDAGFTYSDVGTPKFYFYFTFFPHMPFFSYT